MLELFCSRWLRCRLIRNRSNRWRQPAHLERIEQVIQLENTACSCCGGALHVIGEDVAERLDMVPATFRVLVTRRPRYGSRNCEAAPVQAPAPPRTVEGGLPTEALIAHVLVSKYADHLPLYRQAQIYARQGINLDRSTLADWVGRAAWWLTPLRDHLLAELKRSTKLFADETTAPGLDPGRERTKAGQLRADARDDRPWGGCDPPAVAYVYAPDRKGERPREHLAGVTGVLQVDGYAGYNALVRSNQVHLAYCWSHVRRGFFELAASGPVAAEALVRIARLYAVEQDIRGLDRDARRATRLKLNAPIVADLRTFLDEAARRGRPLRLAAGARDRAVGGREEPDPGARSHPAGAAAQARPGATMTHDYKRNGTTTLFAALNVLDGSVIGRNMQRHRHQEFIRFLNAVEAELPSDRAVHVILDNYATHKQPKARAWLARHPRWTFHFVPTSCSWLNAVEGFFAKLTRRRLKSGIFCSVVDL